jgi:single-stranded-DNA-specific exonuclease
VLNPNQAGCEYPDKNLAGVGVAFKLVHALFREYGAKRKCPRS